MAIALVGGGARSGKSRLALTLARVYGPRLAYLATAEALDQEMEERIARHKAERAGEFTTIEEPLNIAEVIGKADGNAIIVDCLTLWLSNLMHAHERDIDSEIESLVDAVQRSTAAVILVTNEVGCGIVPQSPLGRDFRDRAGFLNQRIASVADEVYWLVSGCPLKVK